ncbi:MAG TPA: hypothetical protein VGE92_08240 [Steroidobacteraceae bacterium]
MHTYYAEKKAAAKTESAKRERLRAGDPDISNDELLSIIEKAEAKRAELLSSQPEAKRNERILNALPAAAKG